MGKKLEPGLRSPFPPLFNLGFCEAIPICWISAVPEIPTAFGLRGQGVPLKNDS